MRGATEHAVDAERADGRPKPLCVDCEHALIHTDLFHESLLGLMRCSPLMLLRLPFWLVRGTAYFRERLAAAVNIDVTLLPYNEKLLDYLREAKQAGRELVLATALPRRQAEAIAGHLQLFDRVEATDQASPLSPARKAERLCALFGTRGFDYAGAGRENLPVWRVAHAALVVHPAKGVEHEANRFSPVTAVFPRPRRGWGAYAQTLRLHQWVKNFLVFTPLLAAHQWSDTAALGNALLAFLAFSLCASSVYLLNDLLDLPFDRAHVRKRLRAFAAGTVPVLHGMLLIPVFLAASFFVALWLPSRFLFVLLGYLVLTAAYSLWLKRLVIVDVLVLATLYTSRVVAGSAATAIVPSFWLLAFSMLIFLSLAIVKRYSEMLVVLGQKKSEAAGRDYSTKDLPMLMSLGTASGYLAVLVLALYVNSPEVHRMYAHPAYLWLLPPPLLYWISRVWMKTHRGEMHDDPVLFAVRDPHSWVIALLVAAAAAKAM